MHARNRSAGEREGAGPSVGQLVGGGSGGQIDGERLRSRRSEVIKERGEDGLLDIDAIAEAYWQIHRQRLSAWTHEIDLRPFKEAF